MNIHLSFLCRTVFKSLFFSLFSLTVFACNNNPTSKQSNSTFPTDKSNDDADSVFAPAYISHEAFEPTDEIAQLIKDIRANFTRINSIKNWDEIIEKELVESTEEGVAYYYFANGILEKVIAKEYGETYRRITEYYFKEGNLDFMYDKQYHYNRPIYVDSVLAAELGDDEWFDFDKSAIHEVRNYFSKGELVHQIYNPTEEIFITDSMRKEFEAVYILELDKILSYLN